MKLNFIFVKSKQTNKTKIHKGSYPKYSTSYESTIIFTDINSTTGSDNQHTCINFYLLSWVRE